MFKGLGIEKDALSPTFWPTARKWGIRALVGTGAAAGAIGVGKALNKRKDVGGKPINPSNPANVGESSKINSYDF